MLMSLYFLSFYSHNKQENRSRNRTKQKAELGVSTGGQEAKRRGGEAARSMLDLKGEATRQ